LSPVHPSRHDLIWLDPSATVLHTSDPDDLALAHWWIETGRPLIVRRRWPDEPVSQLALGLPLPERLGRRRIAMRAHPAVIWHTAPPPLLSLVIADLPATWQSNCQSLAAPCATCGAELRVYGSAAWEWLTGEAYLHPRSDLDLLVRPLAEWDYERGRQLIAYMAALHEPRLDGEIALDNGEFVAWRELLLDAPAILIKTFGLAELRCRRGIEQRLGRSV
jgi:phosphoribosyl-dephospho-CoA transferase